MKFQPHVLKVCKAHAKPRIDQKHFLQGAGWHHVAATAFVQYSCIARVKKASNCMLSFARYELVGLADEMDCVLR